VSAGGADLPGFLGIGALKAGTTYLDAMLRDHPQLCLPAGIKEVEFFNRHHDRGPVWYQQQFRGCSDRLRGEVSPQYLFDPKVAGRISELIPEARLLVSVRDPVRRAYSQYKHWVQETGYGQSFDQFLTDHPGAVDRGRYFSCLRPYLDTFDRDQILILVFDDLIGQPLATMRQVYAFVGVDARHTPAAAGQQVYPSAPPRFHRGYVAAKRVSRRCRQWGLAGVIATGKRAGLGRAFRPSGREPSFAVLLPDTARRLADGYADDVASLSGLLGRDLSALWSST